MTLSMFVDRFRLIENVSYDADIAHRIDVANNMKISPIVFEFLTFLLELLVFSYLVGILFFQRTVFLFVNVAFHSCMNNLKG